jgi:hypothetical protein
LVATAMSREHAADGLAHSQAQALSNGSLPTSAYRHQLNAIIGKDPALAQDIKSILDRTDIPDTQKVDLIGKGSINAPIVMAQMMGC